MEDLLLDQGSFYWAELLVLYYGEEKAQSEGEALNLPADLLSSLTWDKTEFLLRAAAPPRGEEPV